MEICTTEGCNKETFWLDEPEEYCPDCVAAMESDYQIFIETTIKD